MRKLQVTFKEYSGYSWNPEQFGLLQLLHLVYNLYITGYVGQNITNLGRISGKSIIYILDSTISESDLQ